MPGDADASLTVPMSALQRDAKAWQLARRAASVFAELQRSHSERPVLLTSSLCPLSHSREGKKRARQLYMYSCGPAELKGLDKNTGDQKLQVGINTESWRFKRDISVIKKNTRSGEMFLNAMQIKSFRGMELSRTLFGCA